MDGTPYELEGEDQPDQPEQAPPEASERSSLLEGDEEPCPKCGEPMPADAVVCLSCGYDMHGNVVRTVQQGEDVHIEPGEHEGMFTTPGRGGARTLLIVGAVLTIGAMVAAGWLSDAAGGGGRVLDVVLTLYRIAVHTGTGLVAVWVVARLHEERIGRIDLAAGRIFVAFSLFQLLVHLNPGSPWIAIVCWAAGLGAYWLAVWWLFDKTRTVALMLLVAHVVLLVLVEIGMHLEALARQAPAPAGG